MNRLKQITLEVEETVVVVRSAPLPPASQRCPACGEKIQVQVSHVPQRRVIDVEAVEVDAKKDDQEVGFMLRTFLLAAILLFNFASAIAQTSVFTYQGKLTDVNSPPTGTYQMQFSLYDASEGGTQVGTTITNNSVNVSSGVFTVNLDFNSPTACPTCFDGSARWIQIAVKKPADPTFTSLTPRQPLTSAPYSSRSSNSTSAGSVSCSLCITDSHISSLSGSKITGQVPSGAIPANLANYIWNSATQQSGSFNIAGSGYMGNRLGVGTQTPGNFQSKIESFGFLDGLRVQKNMAGGTLVSFGENGIFNIDSAGGTAGGRFTVFENGNVGIGINNPSTRLDVGGTISVRPPSGFATVGIHNTSSSSFAQTQFFDHTGNYRGYIGYMGSTAPFDPIRISTMEIGTNGIDLTLRPGETEVMRLKPTGTVLINNQAGGIPNDNNVRLNVNGVIAANPGGFNVNNFQACFNLADLVISRCTASSIRFKENVRKFSNGLDLISRLSPVYFDWKPEYGGKLDMGLIAEDVAAVEPLLATYNLKGEIEGVKYDRIGVVLINAVKAQQAEIESLKKRVEMLSALVCDEKPSAIICEEN